MAQRDWGGGGEFRSPDPPPGSANEVHHRQRHDKEQ